LYFVGYLIAMKEKENLMNERKHHTVL